jgi:hypothetical protein
MRPSKRSPVSRVRQKRCKASAKDVSEKAMSYAERNSTFAFADRLVHANDVQHVTALQTEFV